MKKVFMGMFAIATMLLATNCSEDELIAQSSGNEVSASFKVSVRSDVKTKAVGDDTDGIDQLIFAVYDENKNLLEELTQTLDETKLIDATDGKKTATINVTLVKGQTYSFAFWAQDADYAAYTFTPATKLVSVNYGQTANNKNADAFFANETLTVSGSFEKDITLKRPFAQVNFLTTQTDIDKAEDAGFVPSQSSIVVKNAATSLNVLDGTVTGSTEATFNLANLIENTETTTIKDAQGSGIKFENTTDVTNFRYLATAYFLTTEGASVTTIDASMNVVAVDNGKMDLSVPGVSATRNYRTNIYGNLLTSGGKFNVTVDPGFDGDYSDEYEDPTTKVVGTIEEAEALMNPTDGSTPVTNVTITEAPTVATELELPNTADDVTINFAFEEGSTPAEITIKGGTTSNNVTVNGDAGNLVINAPNSTVTLNGNYTSVTATTAQNTLIVPKGVTIKTLTLIAGNAEIYYGAVETILKDDSYDGTITWLVDNGEILSEALATSGDIVKLINDISVDADNTISIAQNKTVILDLNGHIVAGLSDQTGANRNMFDVQGTLTVKNGDMTIKHEGENMGWNNSTNVFNVTAGGILKIETANIENLGGSDMAFCVHLNNWGEVTLNAEETTFKSPYVGIRAFNSGYDMNNVTLENCDILTGNGCIWVHNYTLADFGNDETKASDAAERLNFNFTNTTVARTNGSKSLIRFGFTDAIYFSSIEMTEVVAGSEAALKWALANDKNVVLNNDITADVTVIQKENVNITIDGNHKNFIGVMTVFGNGRQSGSETLTIKNINFVAKDGAESCIVSPDKAVNNKYSYSHNVTVENCTFTDLDGTVNCAAIRHEDGGDKNWIVKGCSVDNTMHSILQVNNVESNLTIEDCTVFSKNGANLNSCTNVKMTKCNFDVKGYAVRFGVNKGGNLGVTKTYLIENSTLKSACDDGDAVIMFRASAVDASLTLTNTTLEGTTKIKGNTDSTKINGAY